MKEYIEKTPDLTLTEPTTDDLANLEEVKEESISIDIVDTDSLLTAVLHNDVAALKTYLSVNKSIPRPPYPDSHEIYKKIKGISDKNVRVSKWPLIIVATMLRHVEIVKLLVPRTVEEDQGSAWNTAIALGNKEIITSLIEAGMDINAAVMYGITILSWKASIGDIKAVKLLIEAGADVNARGQTALTWASRSGHFEVLKLLIEAGAELNARGLEGKTALIWAICAGHFEVLNLLIDAGANVNARSVGGETALMCANEVGYVEVVELLLKKGAKIDLTDISGHTVLADAIYFSSLDSNHINIVKALLDHQFKLSQELEKIYIGELLSTPIANEMAKYAGTKYEASISSVVDKLKTLGTLAQQIAELSDGDQLLLRALIENKLSKEQLDLVEARKPEVIKLREEAQIILNADMLQVLKFVSYVMKLNQQVLLHKEMMLDMLCLNKLNELKSTGNFKFRGDTDYYEVTDLLKATIVIKYAEKNKKVVKEFIENYIHSEEIKSWLLNDLMKGVAAHTELIAEDIAPAELVPAAEIVEPEALEVAGELPEDAEIDGI